MSTNLEIRLERARSWISIADTFSQDNDALKRSTSDAGILFQHDHEKFIFYWIAFNCLYGRRQYDGPPTAQMDDIRKFLKKVVLMKEYDQTEGTCILDAAVKKCRRDGRKLIVDRFLDDQYWRGQKKISAIIEEGERDLRRVEWELDTKKSCTPFLELCFSRLKVLRNQILHGCATYGPKSMGHKSLTFGMRFLEVMIPALFHLTERYGSYINSWESPPYPRKGHPAHPWA